MVNYFIKEVEKKTMKKGTRTLLRSLRKDLADGFSMYQDLSDELEQEHPASYDETYHHLERALHYLDDLLYEE